MTIPLSESELNALQQLVGDRYRPLSLLGKKSGRKTLLAEDSETNAKVVIKLLTFGEDFNWDDLKLFEREAETLRSLDHPAIPKYLDYFDVETPRSKGFALVQSYVEARSLADQVKAGRRFSEEELDQLAQQLLDILEYLHSRQPAVIHRDIKPSNILLTDRTAHSVGQVSLVDFGSVQTVAAREGSTITVVGTYGYMPPEQFGGRAVPASDLYSLGATLIYLASGRHPADLPQKQLQMQFENVVQLSPARVQWLCKMTQPDLEQRFRSAVEAQQTQELVKVNSEIASLSAPLNSKIKVQLRGHNLRIVMPAGQLRLRQAQRPIGFWEIMGFTMFCSVVIAFMMVLLFSVLAADERGQALATFGGLISAPLVLGVLWWGFCWYSNQTSAEFRVEAGQIEIRQPGARVRTFQARQAWQLQRRRHLKLLLGSRELLLKGSMEELHWLEAHLRDALNLED